MDRRRLGCLWLGTAEGTTLTQAGNLSNISDAEGRFAVFAIDHRDSLRRFLRPDDPDSLSAAELTDLKLELIKGASDLATGVMLEPEYSIPQAIESGALAEGVGFVAALESQGYLGDPSVARTTVLDGWSPALAHQAGASACKLLIPYNPDKPNAAAQLQVATEILASCRDAGMPLILEPLFFDLGDPAERPRVVLETAAKFAAIGPDVLKLPFPIDITIDADEDHWHAACRTITEVAPMPWVMLSGGGGFNDYMQQLRVALNAGCAGFMVGRALWGEAASAPPADRQHLIETQVRYRFSQLRSLFVG